MIEYYVGVEGPSILGIHNEQELYEVINLIHTMVMDGMSEEHPTLRLLERVMDELMETYPDIEPA